MDSLMGIFTIEDEMGSITHYMRAFPLQLSYTHCEERKYYEIAINILGLELSISFIQIW